MFHKLPSGATIQLLLHRSRVWFKIDDEPWRQSNFRNMLHAADWLFTCETTLDWWEGERSQAR